MIKKHFAVYRDGLLLLRAKTQIRAEQAVVDFKHTGKDFNIKEETVITPWIYAKANGDFGYTKTLVK